MYYNLFRQENTILLSSYRPVALTSCMDSVMKIVTNLRFMWFLERKGQISPAHCGF